MIIILVWHANVPMHRQSRIQIHRWPVAVYTFSGRDQQFSMLPYCESNIYLSIDNTMSNNTDILPTLYPTHPCIHLYEYSDATASAYCTETRRPLRIWHLGLRWLAGLLSPKRVYRTNCSMVDGWEVTQRVCPPGCWFKQWLTLLFADTTITRVFPTRGSYKRH